jgi:hypothetical protein
MQETPHFLDRFMLCYSIAEEKSSRRREQTTVIERIGNETCEASGKLDASGWRRSSYGECNIGEVREMRACSQVPNHSGITICCDLAAEPNLRKSDSRGRDLEREIALCFWCDGRDKVAYPTFVCLHSRRICTGSNGGGRESFGFSSSCILPDDERGTD